MNRRKLYIPVICLLLLTMGACLTQKKYPFQDTTRIIDERVDDLVCRMTLEEKVSQLSYESPGIDRLGIKPYVWWNECLHGVARAGNATVFPQAIGMAAMWDTLQMRQIADAISDEARAKYNDFSKRNKYGIYQGLTFWTPNINIFRDPRWGRGMETYGEDPYLTAELAIQFVKGLQGDDPNYLKLVATAKHFSVHSGPESTRHSFDVRPSDKDLYETYMPHFKRVVQEAKVSSVMCAYQRFRGMPCCGSAFLENILRNEWGFNGYIVSDCWAIKDFYDKGCHEVAGSKEEAAAMAVNAGTDLNCGNTYPALVEAVKQGLVTEDKIDESVKRLMKARMQLGMFDPADKVPYSNIPLSVVESPEHKELARTTAEKSMVLLKNDNNTLPFSKDISSIAVIGPNADELEVLLGNYNGYPTAPVTPLNGLREKLGSHKVSYAVGCPIADELPLFSAIPGSAFFTDMSLKTPGLSAKYYDNSELEGSPKHTRTDKNIDFVWGNKSPFDDINYEHFSVEWEGVLLPPVSGTYAIGGEAFSGLEIFLGDSLLVKRYDVHNPRKEYEHVKLTAGKPIKLKMIYRQRATEYAMARMLWEKPRRNMIEEAVETARNADAVVFCMGLSPLLEGEEMKVKVPGFSGGDRLDINLPSCQTQLMKEVMKLGKPAVLVLFNGSALAINWENENIPAIIEAWYPGQEGGHALANILFGDVNPSGKLPLTFYKSIDQIPAFDDYNMAGKTYRFFKGEPLYEFGYGLSYTTFSYRKLCSPNNIAAYNDSEVLVEVKNTGKYEGDEVVQLYLSHVGAESDCPLRNLAGFKRVHLKPGEKEMVRFTIKADQMALLDEDNFWAVEPGDIIISVGGRQPSAKAISEGKVVQHCLHITE